MGALVACSGAPEPARADAAPCAPAPLEVVGATAWTLVPADADPIRRDPPRDAGTATTALERGRCGPDDVGAEDLAGSPSFSITTLRCSWGTVETRARLAVDAGAPLSVHVWHFSQLAIMATEGTLVLATPRGPLWRTTVPLPTEGALISESFAAPRAVSLGEPVYWHVSNHGQNSWNFLSLAVERPSACPP